MSKIKLDNSPAPEMTLWQLMQMLHNGDLDITGTRWDWGTCMCVDLEPGEDEDYYNKFMRLICMNIKVLKYKPDWYTQTTIEDFMWNNRDIFKPFFNENNRVGYRPKDYKGISPDADTGFYEAYMEPLESLMVGNYTDEDYEYLYKQFEAKAAK